jgi:hypothetical protein
MILQSYNESYLSTSDMDNMTGDPIELAEAAHDLLTETHNLTLAMARFEHSMYLSEEAEPVKEEKKEGAAKSFFRKIGNSIVEFWKKVKAWLIHAYESIKLKIFGPRKSWLEKNGGSIKGPYGDAKASVGSNMKAGTLGQLFREMDEAATQMITAADKPGDDRGNLQSRVMAIYSNFKKNRSATESVSKGLDAHYIGDVKEVSITDALVSEMKAVAEQTFKNIDELKGAQKIADGAIRAAQGMAQATAPEKEKADRMRNIASVGPRISSMIGAATSTNSRANSMAMAALVKAHNAGGKGAKTEAPAAEKQNAGTSVLDAYM